MVEVVVQVVRLRQQGTHLGIRTTLLEITLGPAGGLGIVLATVIGDGDGLGEALLIGGSEFAALDQCLQRLRCLPGIARAVGGDEAHAFYGLALEGGLATDGIGLVDLGQGLRKFVGLEQGLGRLQGLADFGAHGFLGAGRAAGQQQGEQGGDEGAA